MSKLKVCHIVNWYPNKWNDKEAIWTKRHIESIGSYCDNDVFHVQVIKGKFKYQHYKLSSNENSFILELNTRFWILREFATTMLLCYVLLFKISRKKYQIFNFQIAYPLLTYSKLIQFIIRKPIVITEHWSAYHLNFGVKKQLPRIQKIFKNKKLKFICVSKALVNDIENFSHEKIDSLIVPNVINTNIFNYRNLDKRGNVFFMVSFWKVPKDPFSIISIFSELHNKNLEFTLIIGGYGPQLEKMKSEVERLGITGKVVFTGKLNSDEIAENMNKSDYFIHKSDYEVASVVCSESLCCGTPVIASKVGGIVEYVSEEMGVLVDNDFGEWKEKLEQLILSPTMYDNNLISKKAIDLFSEETVGMKYYKALETFYNRFNEK